MAEQAEERDWKWHQAALWATLVVGAILRFVALGRVPDGLNSDEASSGVEALAILRTGADLWGNHLPVWFPAWGSGMNALYSYIMVPVIWLFGLSTLSLRLVGAVFGVLTLPVAYSATRLHFGRDAALIATFLLAVLPWHVMSSRWALDSNLAPLFFTLGLYTIGRALRDGGRWPLLAFLPWVVAAYGYPAVLYAAIPGSLAIMILLRRSMVDDRRWFAGIAVAALLALPLGLFLLKNYLLHTQHLPFEALLPFSVPALATTRLSQIDESFPIRVFHNLTFIAGGYRDDAIWHQSRLFLPLTGTAPYLTLAGAAALFRECLRTRQPNIVLIVAAMIVVPVVALPLQLTRLNWFYIPSLMLAAYFLVALPTGLRRAALTASAFYLSLFLIPFYAYYFTSYNQEAAILDTRLGNGFRFGLEDALRTDSALARPDEPIFLDIGQPQPYLYPLFYGLASVEEFQATRRMTTIGGVFKVSRFGRFYFEKDVMPTRQSFVFVTLSTALPCAAPDMLKSGPIWATGRCPG
jgi:4-amino-4-deoxy-L-arabinose transferase-like glycosyltransferase